MPRHRVSPSAGPMTVEVWRVRAQRLRLIQQRSPDERSDIRDITQRQPRISLRSSGLRVTDPIFKQQRVVRHDFAISRLDMPEAC